MHQLRLTGGICAPTEPMLNPPYRNETSNTTYILNTNQLNFYDAEQICNDNGGHLATYRWGKTDGVKRDPLAIQASGRALCQLNPDRCTPAALTGAARSRWRWRPRSSGWVSRPDLFDWRHELLPGLARRLQESWCFRTAGILYPECHQHYWIGLRATIWPRFNWLDMLLPNPGRLHRLARQRKRPGADAGACLPHVPTSTPKS
jgi:hypothetical protein